MRAPRARACSSSSSTRIAAPSAITKPSRPASKGRDASSGASLRVLSARIAPKAARPVSLTGASAPPASIATAAPRLMISNASPMPPAPAAHAVVTACSGPLVPRCSETCAAPMLGIIIVAKNGLTARGPRSKSARCWSSNVLSPPPPLATTAPMSSASAATSRPASSTAWRAAATAYCE